MPQAACKKIVPLPAQPGSMSLVLEQKMSQYDKGSLEHQAFFFSDVAVALRLSRLPDYIIDLAYSYRGTALHHAAYHGMLPGLTQCPHPLATALCTLLTVACALCVVQACS